MKINEVQTKKENEAEASYRAQAREYKQLVEIFESEGFSREESIQILLTTLGAFLGQQ